jgi:hypothetical protein
MGVRSRVAVQGERWSQREPSGEMIEDQREASL